MTKSTWLVWRLKEAPTSANLRELVKDGILSKDEAREILFSSETEEDRDKRSLESEIKFLRELVEKLSKSRSEIITTIREIEVPYKRYSWWGPYWTWCDASDANSITYCASGSSDTILTSSGIGTKNYATGFSDIKTF